MIKNPGIGEVYRDGEGEIVVVDENGDVKPSDDYSAELDLSSDDAEANDKFDEEAYIDEVRGEEIRTIADAAINSSDALASIGESGLDLSADDDRLTYAAALKRVIDDREARLTEIESTPEYEREEKIYDYYNDNSPVEYYAGPLHEKTWRMSLNLLPLRDELRRVEEIGRNNGN